MKRKYTTHTIAEVQNLHKEGYTYNEIAEITKIPPGTLPKLIYPERYTTTKTKYRTYTEEQKNQVKELYRKGYPYARITQLTGVKRGTIANIMQGETNRVNQPPRKIEYRNRPTQMEMDFLNAEPPTQTDLQKFKIDTVQTKRCDFNCIITPEGVKLYPNSLDQESLFIKHEDFHEILQLLVDADQIILQMKGKF